MRRELNLCVLGRVSPGEGQQPIWDEPEMCPCAVQRNAGTASIKENGPEREPRIGAADNGATSRRTAGNRRRLDPPSR
jgi:hypothetical protein